MNRRTNEELNIIRQAVLDHCHEAKFVDELVKAIDVSRATLVSVMDTLAAYEYLDTDYRSIPSGGKRKYYKTLIATFDPKSMVKNFSQEPSHREPLTPGARKITFNTEHYRDLMGKRAKDARADQRRASHNYVGISPVYYG